MWLSESCAAYTASCAHKRSHIPVRQRLTASKLKFRELNSSVCILSCNLQQYTHYAIRRILCTVLSDLPCAGLETEAVVHSKKGTCRRVTVRGFKRNQPRNSPSRVLSNEPLLYFWHGFNHSRLTSVAELGEQRQRCRQHLVREGLLRPVEVA